MITAIASAAYIFFLVVFGALSWYFLSRVLDMRFKDDKSVLAVRVYSIGAGAIIFATLILYIINNFV